MKKKHYKIFGVALVVMLIASMLAFTVPASAAPAFPATANKWTSAVKPVQGAMGGWFYDPDIEAVGPIAKDKDGDVLYAYVEGTTVYNDILVSKDGGRTWSSPPPTAPGRYSGGRVVDMVCSSLFKEVLYVTDGNYVYKSVDGATTFSIIAKENLEYNLEGKCGIPVTDEPITCIDVGYNGADEPIVFIGTRDVGHIYDASHPLGGKDIVGSVYWIAESSYPAEWDDLSLPCYGCCNINDGDGLRDGCFDVYAVGADPGFANTNKVYAAVTRPTTLGFVLNTADTITVTADATLGATFYYSTPAGDLGWAGSCGGSPVTLAAGASCTFTVDGTHAASEVELTVTAGRLDSVVAAGATTVCPAATQVISSLGTTCAWTFVTELYWDCDVANPFQIRHASRFAFPTDFSDTHVFFLGVTGTYPYGPGGDVYRFVDGPPTPVAIDLNVQGFTTGCLGIKHANICSLDIKGSTDDGSLIAGAWDDFQQDPTNVYYSNDGGWTWAASKKDPTGVDRAYVLWYADSAVAGTRRCDCGFSMSCGEEVGEYWNQIALINTCIDVDEDLSHAPGYIDGASYMYLLTYCGDSCQRATAAMPSTSLFRWDGTYWERVYSSFTYANPSGDALMEWVEVSTDFNTTGCLYLASTDFQMYRSIDMGCSWASLSYPCEPRPSIQAWIVVDEETVLVAGIPSGGGPITVYKTTRHGTRPWDAFPVMAACYRGVDFDLSPKIGSDGQVLLGDGCGNVFISENVGSTWDQLYNAAMVPCNVLSYADTYVQFDPGYGTSGDPGEHMVYAAAGNIIARCNINPDAAWDAQCWEAIFSQVCHASGIDAQGDTALYVSDAGYMGEPGDRVVTIDGSIAMDCLGCPDCGAGDLGGYYYPWGGALVYELDGAFEDGEIVEIISYDLECECYDGYWDPYLGYYCFCWVWGEIGIRGIESGAIGMAYVYGQYWADDANEMDDPYTDCFGSTGIISSHLIAYVSGYSGVADCQAGVWRTLNPMDPIPPVAPVNTVEFEKLTTGLNAYSSLYHDTFTYWSDDLWLTTSGASNILWCLDYMYPTYVWVWDDPLAKPVTGTAPCGDQLLSTGSVTLNWAALDGATEYEIELYQYCPQCPDERLPVSVANSKDTCAIVDGLNPGTEYFWRVRVALGSPFLSKWSDLCSFTTALGKIPELCSPICGSKDIILTTNFSWTEVPGAASYELQIVQAGDDGTSDFTGATTYTTDVNALASIPGLEYSTVYYWRVRAVSGSIPGAWAVCIFTTMDEPVEPLPCPDLVVEIPADEVVTPVWIWVLIGIGAALTIAVVILIVTTRRVP